MRRLINTSNCSVTWTIKPMKTYKAGGALPEGITTAGLAVANAVLWLIAPLGPTPASAFSFTYTLKFNVIITGAAEGGNCTADEETGGATSAVFVAPPPPEVPNVNTEPPPPLPLSAPWLPSIVLTVLAAGGGIKLAPGRNVAKEGASLSKIKFNELTEITGLPLTKELSKLNKPA
jgi:hypothetical protein